MVVTRGGRNDEGEGRDRREKGGKRKEEMGGEGKKEGDEIRGRNGERSIVQWSTDQRAPVGIEKANPECRDELCQSND